MLHDPALRAIWLAIAVLAATITGTGTGILTRLAGAHTARAVIAGGTAFGGTLMLILAILNYLWM
jgi:hypothetical protein